MCPRARREPFQKALPTTEADRRALRCSGGRASMRAAIAARTVVGSSPPTSAPSLSAAVSSSRNSGFPPATPTSRPTASGESSSPTRWPTDSRSLLVRQRIQRDGRLRPQTLTPRRPGFHELRSGQRQEHDGRLPRMRGQVLDEIELSRIGPVHVLEHEQRGPLEAEAFDQSTRREQQDRLLVHRGIEPQPEHQGDEPGDLRDLGVGDTCGQRLHQLASRHVGRVLFEDPGDLLDLVSEGAVDVSGVVRQATAADGPAAGILDQGGELPGQPGLLPIPADRSR